ncbi:MAG: Type 1 glutamine amidotransferase-like domain-containing protein [Actinomycetota bacterium]|nr:Type 1 glutamine amidotransferase-like domain-containing protein [Actinomycetota bacterium]
MLGGGGSAEDSRILDQRFAGWVGQGPLLYLPFAGENTNGYSYPEGLNWLRSVFEPLGVTTFDMETDPEELVRRGPRVAAGVYMGGGNTYRLLHALRQTGLQKLLLQLIADGVPVYGGSAGAIVLGRDISTAERMDVNDPGIDDTHGLDLLEGHSVWCHYTDDQDRAIAFLVEKHVAPILALSERGGIMAAGGRLSAIGLEPVFRFSGRGRKSLVRPGAVVKWSDLEIDVGKEFGPSESWASPLE